MKPILFSTMMVQALLDGTKNQTRRMRGLDLVNQEPYLWDFDIDRNLFVAKYGNATTPFNAYAKTGDILWVRESYAPKYYSDGRHAYKTDIAIDEHVKQPKWKPSIHMPASACRIHLKVNSVRVERLKNILESDAESEGVIFNEKTGLFKNYCSGADFIYARDSFFSLWQSINKNLAESLDKFVVVYDFETIRLSRPNDDPEKSDNVKFDKVKFHVKPRASIEFTREGNPVLLTKHRP